MSNVDTPLPKLISQIKTVILWPPQKVAWPPGSGLWLSIELYKQNFYFKHWHMINFAFLTLTDKKVIPVFCSKSASGYPIIVNRAENFNLTPGTMKCRYLSCSLIVETLSHKFLTFCLGISRTLNIFILHCLKP